MEERTEYNEQAQTPGAHIIEVIDVRGGSKTISATSYKTPYLMRKHTNMQMEEYDNNLVKLPAGHSVMVMTTSRSDYVFKGKYITPTAPEAGSIVWISPDITGCIISKGATEELEKLYLGEPEHILPDGGGTGAALPTDTGGTASDKHKARRVTH